MQINDRVKENINQGYGTGTIKGLESNPIWREGKKQGNLKRYGVKFDTAPAFLKFLSTDLLYFRGQDLILID